MPKKRSLTLQLADVAADQHGLFTTSQARHVGVSYTALNRLHNRGAIDLIDRGVYRLAGTAASPNEDLRAAWLVTDPSRTASERLARPEHDVVVSHRSAARLHDLGNLDADTHEFTASRRKQTRRPWTRFHRADLATADVTTVEGLPVTTIARTLTDLAALPIDGDHLASMVADAIWKHNLAVIQIRELLRPYAHLYGHPPGGDKAFISRMLADAGVPESARQALELAGSATVSPHTGVEGEATST